MAGAPDPGPTSAAVPPSWHWPATGAWWLRAAKPDPDGDHQLVDLERLAHTGVGAHPPRLLRRVPRRGNDHDRNRLAEGGTEPGRDGLAAQARQVPIQNYQRGTDPGGAFERLPAIRRGHDGQPFFLQREPKRLAQVRVVLHDQDRPTEMRVRGSRDAGHHLNLWLYRHPAGRPHDAARC